jgi:hypothetical protein
MGGCSRVIVVSKLPERQQREMGEGVGDAESFGLALSIGSGARSQAEATFPTR